MQKLGKVREQPAYTGMQVTAEFPSHLISLRPLVLLNAKTNFHLAFEVETRARDRFAVLLCRIGHQPFRGKIEADRQIPGEQYPEAIDGDVRVFLNRAPLAVFRHGVGEVGSNEVPILVEFDIASVRVGDPQQVPARFKRFDDDEAVG